MKLAPSVNIYEDNAQDTFTQTVNDEAMGPPELEAHSVPWNGRAWDASTRATCGDVGPPYLQRALAGL